MKKFFVNHRDGILIFIPIVVAILGLCASGFEKRISEIYTLYSIDVATLNNSFITLAVNTANQDKESIQKARDALNDQMETFNNKYGTAEKELGLKEGLASIFNSFIFILLLLQMIFVIVIPPKNSQ